MHRATRYTVYPTGWDQQPDWRHGIHWLLTVEERYPDRWAVSDGAQVCDAKGRWDLEPIPSSRTDAFQRRYRHAFADAIALAERLVNERRINGRTFAEYLARVEVE